MQHACLSPDTLLHAGWLLALESTPSQPFVVYATHVPASQRDEPPGSWSWSRLELPDADPAGWPQAVQDTLPQVATTILQVRQAPPPLLPPCRCPCCCPGAGALGKRAGAVFSGQLHSGLEAKWAVGPGLGALWACGLWALPTLPGRLGTWVLLSLQVTPTTPPTNVSFEAVVLHRKDKAGPQPTVITPHGGPHSGGSGCTLVGRRACGAEFGEGCCRSPELRWLCDSGCSCCCSCDSDPTSCHAYPLQLTWLSSSCRCPTWSHWVSQQYWDEGWLWHCSRPSLGALLHQQCWATCQPSGGMRVPTWRCAVRLLCRVECCVDQLPGQHRLLRGVDPEPAWQDRHQRRR